MYEAQKKYAKEHLARIYIDVKKEVKEKFQKACNANNVTSTQILKDFVNDYIEKNNK